MSVCLSVCLSVFPCLCFLIFIFVFAFAFVCRFLSVPCTCLKIVHLCLFDFLIAAAAVVVVVVVVVVVLTHVYLTEQRQFRVYQQNLDLEQKIQEYQVRSKCFHLFHKHFTLPPLKYNIVTFFSFPSHSFARRNLFQESMTG